ncbi:MAG: hypothetical protein AB8B97_11405 [Granulosicoccus sp.]
MRRAIAAKGFQRRWFTADDWWLGIDVPSAEFDPELACLHDAVQLDKHAALLDSLALWWGHSHDWQPSDDKGSHTCCLTLSSIEHEAFAIVLELPADAVSNAPELPESLHQFVRPAWHRVPARCRLDRHPLSEDDAARLGPGALVVVGASFTPTWPVHLVIDEESCEFDAQIDRADLGVAVTSGLPRPVGDQDAQFCDVYFEPAVEVDLALLESGAVGFRPQRGLCSDIALNGARATIEFGSEMAPLAGELVALGDGFAVRLHDR